ncbi:arsenate reductase ArsC [Mucisphaera sp.]|uniref:arsenate reductase ArsC n=1 Tax=Mucisphaera sp. TaxID=2913024 RepID=UPI003D0C60EF
MTQKGDTMVAGESKPNPHHNPNQRGLAADPSRMRITNANQTPKRRVLILSRNNRCNSQMMEAWIRHIAADRLEVVSAGLMPDDLHPFALEVMFEVGKDISDQHPKPIEQFDGQEFEFVITMCDYARDNCPEIPGARWMIHNPFNDPTMSSGDDERRMGAFRMARDDIHDWAKSFVTWSLQQPTEQQVASA